MGQPRDTSRSLRRKRISNQLTGEVRLASGGDPQSRRGVRTPRMVEIENRTDETPVRCESIRALTNSVRNVRWNTFCSWKCIRTLKRQRRSSHQPLDSYELRGWFALPTVTPGVLLPPAQRSTQHRVVTLKAFVAEARFGSRGNADALGNHSPKLHFLFLPPSDRCFEVVRAQSRGADHDASRYPSGDELERGENTRVLNTSRARRDDDGVG